MCDCTDRKLFRLLHENVNSICPVWIAVVAIRRTDATDKDLQVTYCLYKLFA